MLIDEAGTPLAVTDGHYQVTVPQPGFAESDPRDWWQATVSAVRSLPAEERRNVQAVSFSGQMHGFVLTDQGGEPVRPAMLWSDTRSAAQLDRYGSLDPRTLLQLGNPIVTGMMGPGLLWLKEHEPASLTQARHALQPKDWLRLKFTGRAAAEHSDASATLLYDLEAADWHFGLCTELDLDRHFLPHLLKAGDQAGELLPAVADELDLPAGIPVIAGAADTAAAALGSGLLTPGDAQLTLGSGAQIIVIAESPQLTAEPVIHQFRAASPGHWYRMAAMQNAGLTLDWVRRTLRLSWAELYGSLDEVEPDPELLFLPYLSGERTPLLDPTARASWQGLHLGHSPKHLAAAALTGVALSIRAGLQALNESGSRPQVIRVAGGGSRSQAFVQLLADVLQVPLALSDTPAASALGAALLARGGQPVVKDAQVTHEPEPMREQLVDSIESFQKAVATQIRQKNQPKFGG